MNVRGTTKLDLGIATIVDKRNGPYDGSNNVNNGMFEQSLRVPSHIIPPRYSNGEWSATPDGRSSPARIAHDIGGGNRYTATLRPNIKLKQDLGYLLKGLSISGLFSFDVYTDATVATQHSSRTFYAEGRDAAGDLITRQVSTSTDVLTFASARSTNRRMYSEASLNYQQTFGDHEVGGLLLFNQSEYIDGGATTFTTAIPFRNRGLTGRATYGYNNRYFVEGNFSYTGSENFSPDNRFGFFPSFGVGWIMSNEKFFAPLTDILPYFKLRYSYGLTGNGGVANNTTRFLYLDVLTKTASGIYQFGTPTSLSTNYGGYTQSQIATDPSWETSYRHNLGVEMNFLHNDLKIIAELFRERREGILRDDQTISAIAGFGSEWPIRNIGIVLNKGVDLTLTYNKAFSKSKWLNITGTFTYNDNTNLEDGLPPQPYPWMEWKGKEVDAKTLYTALGVFESQEEIDKWAKQTGDIRPGDIKYADLNGDGVINNFDVARVNVSGTPKMMYGVNISFGYKGFDIGAFIQGTGRVWLLYGSGDGTFPFGNGANSPNLYAIIKDRWTEENPNPIPGLATAKDGTLLAIYDVRRQSARDLQGDIDIGLSRSTDGGQTWQPMQIVLDMQQWGGLPSTFNGVSDACILVNDHTGTIFIAGLWMHGVLDEKGKWIEGLTDTSTAWNHQWRNKGSQPGFDPKQTAQFLITKSDNNGKTWSKPINLTTLCKQGDWWLWAPAPGHGITLRDGTLVFPTQGRDKTGKAFSNITYSKDGGNTWTTSHRAAPESTTENMAVELSDGSIMLNMRCGKNKNDTSNTNGRVVAVTTDLGNTWSPHPSSRGALPEPVCMASIIRHDYNSNGKKKSVLLFSNPDSKTSRHRMTIKISYDDGLHWPAANKILLDEWKSRGYSCLTSIDNDTIGILYESSQADMVFQKIRLKDLLQ